MEHFLKGIAPLKTQICAKMCNSSPLSNIHQSPNCALASKKCSIKVPTKGKTTF